MKKTPLAALALALPLTIGSALASTATPLNNLGGTILDNGNEAIVSIGSFDLSKWTFSAGSSITLTFRATGTHDNSRGDNEKWSFVVAASEADLSSTSSSVRFKDEVELDNLVLFSTSSHKNLFDSIDKSDHLYYGFVEKSKGSDAFNLGEVTLTPKNIVSSVPEPESYAMLLSGLALMATVARRRKGKQG